MLRFHFLAVITNAFVGTEPALLSTHTDVDSLFHELLRRSFAWSYRFSTFFAVCAEWDLLAIVELTVDSCVLRGEHSSTSSFVLALFLVVVFWAAVCVVIVVVAVVAVIIVDFAWIILGF